jgi:hypothetical protein
VWLHIVNPNTTASMTQAIVAAARKKAAPMCQGIGIGGRIYACAELPQRRIDREIRLPRIFARHIVFCD